MKNVKTILTSVIFIMLLSVAAFAGNESKVIAVVNKADWCHICKENGMRAMETFKKNDMDTDIQFINNNLTNDKTKMKSMKELKKIGLDKAMANRNGTGVVYFFDADSKMLINQVSLTKSNDELVKAMESAKKSAK